MKKVFKVVFVAETNQYEVWFTDHTGEFVMSSSYSTFTKSGEVFDSSCDGVALISENILWEFNKLVDLGYKFVGIDKR